MDCCTDHYPQAPSFNGLCWGWIALLLTLSLLSAKASQYGLENRPEAKPFLNGLLPAGPDGVFPGLLSQSGVFPSLANLIPSDGFIPFEINSPLWSDGADKARWISLPAASQITFSPSEPWIFPAGTVFVKHFELSLNDTNPSIRKRLETRLLVVSTNGGILGATYRWRADQTDADLLTAGATETLVIQGTNGIRKQRWSYPSSADCLSCHTPRSGQALGAKRAQLQRFVTYSTTGITASQLATWKHLGLFANPPEDETLEALPPMVSMRDQAASAEDRVRSYLDANCSSCHHPEGPAHATFDARFQVPIWRQGLVNGRVAQELELMGARVIAPGDADRSMIPARLSRLDEHKMPPIGRNTVDALAVRTIRDWISGLPRQGGPYRLVATGTEWKFRDEPGEPDPAWKEAGYDDRGWQTGAGEFGFGDGDEITVLKLGLSTTAYFRREFNIEHATLYTNLIVRVLRDDGARVFLNGKEILRTNLPDGELDASTPALFDINGDSETQFVEGNVSAALLVDGKNVIAAEVHQSLGLSGDLSFDLELLGWTSSPSLTIPPRLELTRGPAYAPLELRLSGFDTQAYLVEASSDFANWTPHWTNTTSGGLRSTPVAPGPAPARFYRARVWP